jgi:hypothetical protein
MPSIVTASQLRQVLGVSVSLYSDAYLEGIIVSAEQVILPLLNAYQSAVAGVYLTNDVAYYITQRPHHFVEGQSVVISGCVPSLFNGTITVTSNNNVEFLALPFPSFERSFVFTADKVNADVILRNVIPAGVAYLSGANAATLYASTEAIEQAILIVSTEIFQSVTAAGGQIEGVDFQPSPYRMGRSLQNRVIGLLGSYIDVETMAQ